LTRQLIRTTPLRRKAVSQTLACLIPIPTVCETLCQKLVVGRRLRRDAKNDAVKILIP
jgi:hypothetical protein